MSFQVRQGDVFLRRLAVHISTQTAAGNHDALVLAYGELTGHIHSVRAVDRRHHEHELPAAHLFQDHDGRRFLFVSRACELTHDEHGPITLAPGAYSVTIQREYEPAGLRNVVD